MGRVVATYQLMLLVGNAQGCMQCCLHGSGSNYDLQASTCCIIATYLHVTAILIISVDCHGSGMTARLTTQVSERLSRCDVPTVSRSGHACWRV